MVNPILFLTMETTHLTTIKNKIISQAAIVDLMQQWNKQKVVFTNGCFDILHQGHITYLAQTADLGDKLIVGINSDASVRMLNKGTARPLQDEYSRALIIASLSFVDAVIIFDEATPLQLISAIQPQVLVKGGDYDSTINDPSDKKYIVGSDVVKQNGGEVIVVPFLPGYSTTSIEEKIKRG